MKPPLGSLLTSTSIPTLFTNTALSLTRSHVAFRLSPRLKRPSPRGFLLGVSCSSDKPETNMANFLQSENEALNFEVRMPLVSANLTSFPKLSLSDQAFFLLAFIACTTSVAFTSLVVAAVPTLFAMRRAAISLSRLADTAREELPSTMAAVRLSGMEISDLILELSDLSHEIADGVSKSAQAVQAAEAGVRQIGSLAHQQTMSMIQERASLPIISIQPVVAGAAKKTSRAIGQASKNFLNMFSRGEFDSTDEVGNPIDRIES